MAHRLTLLKVTVLLMVLVASLSVAWQFSRPAITPPITPPSREVLTLSECGIKLRIAEERANKMFFGMFTCAMEVQKLGMLLGECAFNKDEDIHVEYDHDSSIEYTH